MKSLRQALGALFSFRTWVLVLIPPFLTGFVLSVLFLVYWNPLSAAAISIVNQWSWMKWIENILGYSESISSIFSGTMLILLFIPVLFVTVLLVTSIFVTPLVQREVALNYFKDLEMKKGGSTLGSLWNSLKSLMIFLVLFALTLPMWLIPGMQLVVPTVLIIWLNKRIFVYDVLQDFASKEERCLIEKKESAGLWGLGACLVIFSYIPLAFVILPVFSAFAYSFFGLNSLRNLRKT